MTKQPFYIIVREFEFDELDKVIRLCKLRTYYY